jgi:hypothetical protein
MSALDIRGSEQLLLIILFTRNQNSRRCLSITKYFLIDQKNMFDMYAKKFAEYNSDEID